MSEARPHQCDACERTIVRAHRVHAGLRYCQTCYSREFKRLMCGGCGMFRRLLASEPNARCLSCISAQPCVRCKRAGRPVGVITPSGPACNACRVYFVPEKGCEICGTPSRHISKLVTDEGDKKVCPACLRKTHHTCTSCRRFRACDEGADGRLRCKRCTELGQVSCVTCERSMPAGYGSRCEACYWRSRCNDQAKQLVELITRPRVRDAFLAFVPWVLKEDGRAQRTTQRLRTHADFFVTLDKLGDVSWTGALLLEHFGTTALRRYELPVRWLVLSQGIELKQEDKQREADRRRLREAPTKLPAGSLGRHVLGEFVDELMRRQLADSLTMRSARLAVRPAFLLLTAEDPDAVRLPSQEALARCLGQVPGQRAAISTFLGFLKSKYGLELLLPPKSTPNSASVRKALEKQMATIVLAQDPSDAQLKRWLPLAMRYFHRMSQKQAKEIIAASTIQSADSGWELRRGEVVYWLPKAFG